MQDFRLYERVFTLENLVDAHEKTIYNLQQQMFAMVEQIKYLKLKNLKGDENGSKV